MQVIEALTVGGAERLVVELAGEFAQRGVENGVLCLSTPGRWARDLDSRGLYLGCVGKSRGVDLAALGVLKRRIREFAPDVVHSHLFTANLWTRLAFRKRRRHAAVVTLHNIDDWRRAIHRFADGVLRRATDAFVAVSPAVRDYYVLSGLRPESIAVIPNGIGWSEEEPAEPLRADVPVIRACGRLVPQKGFAALIEAARILDTRRVPFRMEIVGDGPERARLEELITRHGVAHKVTLAGGRDDARRLIASCDVFVLPSLREGLPLVVLEALHAGRPIIASDLDGLRGVLEDGDNALLVDPGSPAALASAVEKLLADRTVARAIARKGRASARSRFSIEQAAQSYLDVYEAALRRRTT
jgi:glycosyltransferase involved in cell wall biosynthesis